ncbi:endonuclease MutS2 [Methanobacterium alkalithermotolerans]|uniref:DNA-binding protein MutS2 n=1 Tax=Methanobacterium alkalithermotolerans TaxID=2731220 RepID=A0A8T8K5C5_9EURY|nr:endonuclease MutS2 [Methanobacterium alkalithermotolerans]QUH23734.1 endonuclease MutS2 [Methanobacterium alkalithermotolerans]
MAEKLDLTTIKGVGERMAQKIILKLGGEEELVKVIENYEVDRLASIEGISQRKAIEIVNGLLGNPAQKFLKTDRSRQLYEEIIEKIMEYAHTSHARNKILLLAPTTHRELIQKRLDLVNKSRKMVSTLPLEKVTGLLKNLHLPKNSKPLYDPSKAILVENQEDMDYLMEIGINQYYPVISNVESREIQQYETVFYLYSSGEIELDDAGNVIMISLQADMAEIIPDVELNYFKDNEDIFRQVLELRGILKKESVLGEVMEILSTLQGLESREIDFDKVVKKARVEADGILKESIKKVDLKGDEVLHLLNQGLPPKIEKIFDQVIRKARDQIKIETGVEFDPFFPTYPLEIDQQEVERIKKREISRYQIEAFDKKVKAAGQLSLLKEKVEKEISEALEFDYEFALGCFAHYYQLEVPEISDEFSLEGALHLNLAQEEDVQRIDYHLSYPENVALLTGANSGGKTTLLETLAQISIMTQMGLPVCAKNARVKILDEIYFFSKKRSLDAGAFESFLHTFMPIVIKDSEKLILLDELEAITELEAAVKIISSFIEFIQNSNSFAVIVTHMARELMKHSTVRVDGIEASGLDEDYNLIVDRTPRINYMARSTPELILRMIYNRSQGDLKEVYRKMLEKF